MFRLVRRSVSGRFILVPILGVSLCAGACASLTSVNVTSSSEKSWDDLQKDQAECEAAVATRSTSVGEGFRVGAPAGVLLAIDGAASGAWNGFLFGGTSAPGEGAAIGAGVGMFVGVVVGFVSGVNKAKEEQRSYIEAYKDCLRERGYTIAGEAADKVAQGNSGDKSAEPTTEESDRTLLENPSE